ALRGAQGCGEAHPRGRGARQPPRAAPEVHGADAGHVGQGRHRRALSVARGERREVGGVVLVPLYGLLRGGTMGRLVLVHDDQRVRDIAAGLQEAASVRVAPKPTAKVYRDGTLLDPELTVTEAGFTALDRVDVVPEDA